MHMLSTRLMRGFMFLVLLSLLFPKKTTLERANQIGQASVLYRLWTISFVHVSLLWRTSSTREFRWTTLECLGWLNMPVPT